MIELYEKSYKKRKTYQIHVTQHIFIPSFHTSILISSLACLWQKACIDAYINRHKHVRTCGPSRPYVQAYAAICASPHIRTCKKTAHVKPKAGNKTRWNHPFSEALLFL